MAASSQSTPERGSFQNSTRPPFCLGQYDSNRWETLTNSQHNYLVDIGFNFVTTPITNKRFHERVLELCKTHAEALNSHNLTKEERANPSLPGPIVPTLTDEDTTLFPGDVVSGVVGYTSPWIDLASANPLIASLSRQVLNIEVAYANFCGVRNIIIPGPRDDCDEKQVAQYARAIQEVLLVANRVNLIVHVPMYPEPGLGETIPVLGSSPRDTEKTSNDEVDIFSSWDAWHTIRSICEYNMRLFVAVRIPRRLPDIEVQTRWFAEPLFYLTIGQKTFQDNRAGYPSLSKLHQTLVNMYMGLKITPYFLLCDVGPTGQELRELEERESSIAGYPSLSEAATLQNRRRPPLDEYVAYMKHLETQQPPIPQLEASTLLSFQDWLQSPLQPLSDNLESSTYEMFEGDPVKYDQYEKAMVEAMAEWKELKKPTSSTPGEANTPDAIPELIVAVAGAGRGPLVTRALRASEKTGMPIQLWALEKNQNAYVYLLRQNKLQWGGRVTVVKTDMREWRGPTPKGSPNVTTKVDIPITELLGSFADNELSPECLDGIQRHIARPHGTSIPQSYTAHLSPISYPKVHADIASRVVADPNAFETPWVVLLYAIDFVSQKVSGHDRFQQAWEFVHPVRMPYVEDWATNNGDKKVQTWGGGAMNLSAGLNEHNARHCHLTFVCKARGVIHGLAGYFESVLYQPQIEGKEPVEISTLPEQIDRKSKDMISWFPIFFPLKKHLYFPQDSELEVSMWRQTDDTKVWYEWMVEAFTRVGENKRVKVGASELHSSRKVACLM